VYNEKVSKARRKRPMNYADTVAARILSELWKSPIRLTPEEIGGRIGQPARNISAALANLKKVPEVLEQLEWDETKKPWSYSLNKGVPLDELYEAIKRYEKTKKLKKGATDVKAKVGTTEIYAGPIVFPKGMAFRITGDFVMGKVTFSADAVIEIVNAGEGRKQVGGLNEKE
jgi:hypothetical protein